MLYHAEVYWPKHVRKNLPFGVRVLQYSQHAIAASQDDRYGEIPLPRRIRMEHVTVFEAEAPQKGRITKIALRMPIDDDRDVVMAAIPQQGGLFVKTVWINVRSDGHATLDKRKYVQP